MVKVLAGDSSVLRSEWGRGKRQCGYGRNRRPRQWLVHAGFPEKVARLPLQRSGDEKGLRNSTGWQ